MSTATYDRARDLVKTLAPREQLRLVGEIVDDLAITPAGADAERLEVAACPIDPSGEH